MTDRDKAIARIKAALLSKTGQRWSVTGGRGTAWGWITVAALPARRVCHEPNPDYDWRNRDQPAVNVYIERPPRPGETAYHTSNADCTLLAQAFGLERPVHDQGLSISPESREFYVAQVEKGL